MKDIIVILGRKGAGKKTIKDYLKMTYNLNELINNGWNIDDLQPLNIYVTTPTNLFELKKEISENSLDINIKSIYIKTNAETRKYRTINAVGVDDKLEAENDFFQIETIEQSLYDEFEKKKLYNYCIDNSDSLSNSIYQIMELRGDLL